MSTGTAIVSVSARQVFSDRGHPGVEATVTTESGAQGVAICTAGVSVGSHEVEFAYDGGTKWRGKGVMRAVNAVNDVIAPALIGMDAAQQQAVDDAMLDLGKPIKARWAATPRRPSRPPCSRPARPRWASRSTSTSAASTPSRCPCRASSAWWAATATAAASAPAASPATPSWPTASRPSPTPPMPAGTSRPSGRTCCNEKFGVPKHSVDPCAGRPARRRQARSRDLGRDGRDHQQAGLRGQDRHPGRRRHRDLLGRGPGALRRHLLGRAEDQGRPVQALPDDGQGLPLRHPRGPVRRGRLREPRRS